MKPWVRYSAGQLRRALEGGAASKAEKGGRYCGGRECLHFIAASTRSNGGFPNSGLNIPESIQFFVGPPACGRHGDFDLLAGGIRSHRFYRIRLTEQDLVNGTGPEKVSRQVCAFLDSMEEKPRVVSLCITCVDALLNADYDGLGILLKKRYGIRFVIIRMFPILAESIRTHSQMLIEAQYSVLQPSGGKQKAVNLLGRIRECNHESELYRVLNAAGYRVNNILECRNLAEYDALGNAELNLVVVKNALPAARMMQKKYGIPYVEFLESCNPDDILKNYRRLEEALGVSLPVDAEWAHTCEKARTIGKKYADCSIAIGHGFDFEPLKLASDLCRFGLPVRKVFANEVKQSDLPYLLWLEENRPDMEIYLGTDPEFLGFAYQPEHADLTIGMEATLFLRNPGTRALRTTEEPCEFYGLNAFLDQIDLALENAPDPGGKAPEKNPYGRSWGVYRKGL